MGGRKGHRLAGGAISAGAGYLGASSVVLIVGSQR